ncbi:S8 family peptidase [Rhizobium sp. PEPV16]|uniref:S8 family peptidase n=1 Tax=Rhizobium sp. PEPV16 TaxID=1820614 RepID=UPI0015E1623F|nr:S8 family peptidase [Rhizobium sp. PEPV16]KAF5883536.1 S8 family peptidase [Rhizobium sp. PEPV16]
MEVTLHPSYLAKSYYPAGLIDALGLHHLGSRAVHVIPDKVVTAKAEESGKAQPAPVLYLAGDADRLIEFSRAVANWSPRDENIEDAFRRIESVTVPGRNRLKALSSRFDGRDTIPMEVVLHNPDELGNSEVILTFAEFLRSLDVRFDLNRQRQSGGLAFLPIVAPRERLDDVLDFSFLRVLREAPRIVPFDPVVRSVGRGFPVTISTEEAVAPDLSVAIFDGGLPVSHGLDQWVTLRDAAGVGAAVASAQAHGLAVTSSFLFGPLSQGQPVQKPYANVDHWRVYGDTDSTSDFEAFDILDRIEAVLTSRRYDFINISLGPDYAVDDDDVSPWTARLDQILSNGETVATIACGNNGERDRLKGLHRVQPPSDGVNMLAVGASDSFGSDWKRASYSACGPGRSPGYVKPDFVAFGGSHSSPFLALSAVQPHAASGTMGTSFAAPLAMRSGAGVRAQFTEPLWAPAVKALLVHHANGDETTRRETGWGFLSHGLGDLVLCDDYEAHIVYQRLMPTTGAVRLYLPVPDGLTGMVEIKATFSFFCEVDPEDAINYTRAGLDIQFRPDTTSLPAPYYKGAKLITPTVPASDSFFSAKNFYATEHMQRDDAQKWETTLSRTKTKRASSLNQPAFDVSYVAREHGHGGRRSANMKFALALTIRNRSAKDLYDRVIVSSGNRLQAMRPRVGVQVPIRLPR